MCKCLPVNSSPSVEKMLPFLTLNFLICSKAKTEVKKQKDTAAMDREYILISNKHLSEACKISRLLRVMCTVMSKTKKDRVFLLEII